MDELIEMKQAGPNLVEMVLADEDGVHTVPFLMSLAYYVYTTGAEHDAVYFLARWLEEADQPRWFRMEIAFLQFDMNPGNECFVDDEIRDLRQLLAEQRGTARWNDGIASLLAKFEEVEAGLAKA